jgi:hypothetical protein
MKTLVQMIPVSIITSVSGFRRLNDRFVEPLKAGFLGFAIILLIIFFINLLSYLTGSNEKFGMDFLDLLLAGLGFLLQMTGAILKNFVK